MFKMNNTLVKVNPINSRVEKIDLAISYTEKINNLLSALHKEIYQLKNNRPIMWHMCGIFRGIYNFLNRLVKPFINPWEFLDGIKNMIYLLFTDPIFLVKQIINSGVKYATDDPVAFTTELAINIVLAVFTFGKFSLVSASTHGSLSAVKAMIISGNGISLPPFIPAASLAATTSTLSSSNAFFSLTSTSNTNNNTHALKKINSTKRKLAIK